MSRDVITVGSTMRIPLMYRGEYSQWRERFMNYLEEQTNGEAMINSIQNGDQPLPEIAQVSLAGTAQNAPPTLKDPKFWTAKEKKTRKIDRHARSLLIQGLLNDIYSLIDSNETAKDLWDALERQMCGSEYGEQDRKAAILYEQTKNLMDINIDALYNILKQNQGDVNDALGYKKKAVVINSDPLALVAEKTNSNDKKEDKKSDEKKRDMSKVKCYNCKKEGHFAKDYKKVKVKDYEYYKTKMLLAKKDKHEQVLLAEDQAWMKSSSDSDQEINANMVFMAQIKKVLSDSEASSSSVDEKIFEQSGNPTFSLHKEITSLEVTHEIHDSEGYNFLSEELPDIDSFNDIHPHFDDNPLSGSTTYSSNLLLEEFTDEIALITYPSDYDDNLKGDIEDDDLPSPDNEVKVFNPGILIHEKSVTIITRVAKEKKLAISYASLVFEDFDPPFYEPIIFKDSLAFQLF
uniref:CCHC-type domain-containing protein n=1 Tax=Tanacetum cinerariifolium TaxID=118510 RepID=A0A6L2LZ42_TANCI|nr:hypothetical protein [Tanacetum cinerariifolium]